MIKISRFFGRRTKNILFSLLFVLIFAEFAKATEPPNVSNSKQSAEFQANLGTYYWQRGKLHQAIDAWLKEAEIYRSQEFKEREAEAILKIAQTYTSLGQLELAIFQLKKLLNVADNPSIIARTWEKLGNAYSRGSQLDEALLAYNKSLHSKESLSALNNLVILLQKQILYAEFKKNASIDQDEIQRYTKKSQEYKSQAFDYAKKALFLSQKASSSSSIRALIEWDKLSSTGLSSLELEQGRRILNSLNSSRTKVFLTINWAKLDDERQEYWLLEAVDIAESIEDKFAESYALLELGLKAERLGNFDQALKYAKSVQSKAELKSGYRSLYESQWLAGRIYRIRGEKEAAILSFRNAIDSLDAFNRSFTTINIERRIDFSLKIEPIYRGLLELLLDGSDIEQANLKEALLISGKLRLAQLENYFGDNCFELEVESSFLNNNQDSRNTALINSIILENATYFILRLSDGTFHYSKSDFGKNEINKLATDWYESVKDSSNWQYSFKALDLYNIIIAPFEQKIQAANPDILTFVHDGVLRNIPMAALYDGEKFLTEKWAIISSLGLKSKEKVNQKKVLKLAAFGLGVPIEGWSQLNGIYEEVENVVNIIRGKKFLDQNFTTVNFANQLNQNNYSVLHLASHANFGGIAENSLILAYDKSFSALDFKKYLFQSKIPIQLLVLSGCETAVGNDYSILGLGGVALRSRVNAVLGSFWDVQDALQPQLVQNFYLKLEESKFNPALALQQIQIEQIKLDAHPAQWASFNLIEDY